MPRKVITAFAPPQVATVQVEVTLPLRQRRCAEPRKPIDGIQRLSDRPRIPRIVRLMALALKFQDMVDRGEVRDYADMARLGYVTRARMSQIMNLLLLAPDIQEALLFVEESADGSTITEHEVRRIAAAMAWPDQRDLWKSSVAASGATSR